MKLVLKNVMYSYSKVLLRSLSSQQLIQMKSLTQSNSQCYCQAVGDWQLFQDEKGGKKKHQDSKNSQSLDRRELIVMSFGSMLKFTYNRLVIQTFISCGD